MLGASAIIYLMIALRANGAASISAAPTLVWISFQRLRIASLRALSEKLTGKISSQTARTAGCACSLMSVRIPSIRRRMSRGSEHMLKSMSGPTIGSADFSLTSPVENDRLTHIMMMPMRLPMACQAERSWSSYTCPRAGSPRCPTKSADRRELAAQRWRQARRGFQEHTEIDAGMLVQILADAGALMHDFDAERA